MDSSKIYVSNLENLKNQISTVKIVISNYLKNINILNALNLK